MGQFQLSVAIHPGEILREWLQEQQMTSKELCIRMAKPEKTISAILNGKSAITPDIATSLELVTGVKASMWLSLQRTYEEVLAKQAKRVQYASLWEEWGCKFPLAQMVKVGWIPPAKSIEDKMESLLAFFGLTNADALQSNYLSRFKFAQVQLRATQGVQGRSTEGVLAWIRQGERLASRMIVPPYQKERTEAAFSEIKKTLFKNDPKGLQNLCASLGIKLVYVENIAKASLSGAALWQGNTPIIILSGKGKTHDKFVFNFLHELGHILKHRSRNNTIYIDEEVYGNGEMEDEANNFASAFLIDELAYNNFVQQPITQTSILRFAHKQGVQPTIVLGRLMHDKYISYVEGNSKYKHLVSYTHIEHST